MVRKILKDNDNFYQLVQQPFLKIVCYGFTLRFVVMKNSFSRSEVAYFKISLGVTATLNLRFL